MQLLPYFCAHLLALAFVGVEGDALGSDENFSRIGPVAVQNSSATTLLAETIASVLSAKRQHCGCRPYASISAGIS